MIHYIKQKIKKIIMLINKIVSKSVARGQKRLKSLQTQNLQRQQSIQTQELYPMIKALKDSDVDISPEPETRLTQIRENTSDIRVSSTSILTLKRLQKNQYSSASNAVVSNQKSSKQLRSNIHDSHCELNKQLMSNLQIQSMLKEYSNQESPQVEVPRSKSYMLRGGRRPIGIQSKGRFKMKSTMDKYQQSSLEQSFDPQHFDTFQNTLLKTKVTIEESPVKDYFHSSTQGKAFSHIMAREHHIKKSLKIIQSKRKTIENWKQFKHQQNLSQEMNSTFMSVSKLQNNTHIKNNQSVILRKPKQDLIIEEQLELQHKDEQVETIRIPTQSRQMSHESRPLEINCTTSLNDSQNPSALNSPRQNFQVNISQNKHQEVTLPKIIKVTGVHQDQKRSDSYYKQRMEQIKKHLKKVSIPAAATVQDVQQPSVSQYTDTTQIPDIKKSTSYSPERQRPLTKLTPIEAFHQQLLDDDKLYIKKQRKFKILEQQYKQKNRKVSEKYSMLSNNMAMRDARLSKYIMFDKHSFEDLKIFCGSTQQPIYDTDSRKDDSFMDDSCDEYDPGDYSPEREYHDHGGPFSKYKSLELRQMLQTKFNFTSQDYYDQKRKPCKHPKRRLTSESIDDPMNELRKIAVKSQLSQATGVIQQEQPDGGAHYGLSTIGGYIYNEKALIMMKPISKMVKMIKEESKIM